MDERELKKRIERIATRSRLLRAIADVDKELRELWKVTPKEYVIQLDNLAYISKTSFGWVFNIWITEDDKSKFYMHVLHFVK